MYNVVAATEVKRQYRFHILGLVHLPVSRRYMACAFTQKIEKMCRMLMDLGHEVFLYGAESSDAPCTEFVETHTLSDIRREWGEGDNRFDVGYNWHRGGFKHDFNAQRTATTHKFLGEAAKAIGKRKKDDDFLLLMQGDYHRPVAKDTDLFLTCEPGIGYRGSYCTYRAFESAYLMNFTMGSNNPGQSIDGAYYWRVIPNYFEEQDFPFQDKKEDYFFYIGRMIKRKGVMTAVRATQLAGAKLILAGQQDAEINVKTLPPHCKFIGYVGPEERSELMGKAKGVFVPTIYLEAFGGTNVEAQLCGTPVITTDFGVFPETVIHGKTGYRCSTMQDFVDATQLVKTLDSSEIRKHAERYLTSNVQWEFQKWWDDLYNVYESIGKPKGSSWGWNHVDIDRFKGKLDD